MNAPLTVSAAFALATDRFNTGKLGEAANICQQIVTAQPQFGLAWHMLGVIANRAGHRQPARAYLGKAAALLPDSSELFFDLGNLLRDLGDAPAAETALRTAIKLRPDLAAAHHNLGLLLNEQERLPEAIAQLERALALRPDYPQAFNNLGIARKKQGETTAAIAAFQRAIELQPNFAQAHHNLGVILKEEGELAAAIATFRRAVELAPDYHHAWNKLGNALFSQGELHEAIRCYERAITLKPDFVEAYTNLGLTLVNADQAAAAVGTIQRSLLLKPDNPSACNNLGNAYLKLHRPAQAEEAFRKALEFSPEYAEALANLGNALVEQDRPAEALAVLLRAHALRPAMVEVCTNLGVAYKAAGEPTRAVEWYERALALKPGLPLARFGRSLALLVQGEFAVGWADYECRWEGSEATGKNLALRPSSRLPQWRGEAVEFARSGLAIHSEQGMGDCLQFARYLLPCARRFERVVLMCHGPLARLFHFNFKQLCQVVPAIDETGLTHHVPLLSLPLAFGTTLETIPGTVPYLRTPERLSSQWRQRLGPRGGVRVGLTWAGGKNTLTDPKRSVTLEQCAPLFAIPGVSWVSLQKGDEQRQLAATPPPVAILDPMAEVKDFLDTAAIVANLDIVISVDTAVAHLAGAMGKPVWLLNRFESEWRWLLGREDCPWYPTLRVFRQERPGDWSGVIRRMATELGNLAAGHE